MRFDIITIFPHIFDSYFDESILLRAQKNKLISINVHNLRDWALDKHHTTDDTPYGGGAGMVMKVEPIYKCVQDVVNVENVLDVQDVGDVEGGTYNKCSDKTFTATRARIILFSAKGKKYTQRDVERLSQYDHLILICGRYEGVDERVATYIADEEISIGEYVLTGGELPAMILVDSISRLIPGVLGNPDSLKEESFGGFQNSKFKIQNSFLEHAQYTKPEDFQGWKVPEVLLSGNHKEIDKWREKNTNQ